MKLPVYHVSDGDKLKKAKDLIFDEIGCKHSLHAERKTVIGTVHTAFTGNPHPRFLIFEKDSIATFELRSDLKIYICCNMNFKCEGQHSHQGPYQVFDIEPNSESWISGVESPFFRAESNEEKIKEAGK